MTLQEIQEMRNELKKIRKIAYAKKPKRKRRRRCCKKKRIKKRKKVYKPFTKKRKAWLLTHPNGVVR